MNNIYSYSFLEKLLDIKIVWDTITFTFNNEKELTLSSEKNVWDWDIYFDFSQIEFYKEKLLSEWRCDRVEIKKIEGEWILLLIWCTKIFIPWYHHYTYYTSDIVLLVTTKLKDKVKEERFDLSEFVETFY